MKNRDLRGKTALVTGAGGGVGRAVAYSLAEQGVHLALCDANEQNLEITVTGLAKAGISVCSSVTDISNADAVSRFFQMISETLNEMHILVNCAAVWDSGNIEEIDSKRLDRVLDINLKGTFHMCREAFSLMQKNGAGCIVNFASTAGEYGSIRPASHYAASKGGVIALSKSLAREGAPYGIRVNVVSPGPIDTQMLNIQNDSERTLMGERTLLGRVGTPEDMAEAVLFLASASSSWITGEVLRVNGGSLL